MWWIDNRNVFLIVLEGRKTEEHISRLGVRCGPGALFIYYYLFPVFSHYKRGRELYGLPFLIILISLVKAPQ